MANPENPDDIRKAADEKAVDPQDLVSKGGYRKHPRSIVENPAVTPQMYDGVEPSRAGEIREDRDEDGEDIRYL